MAKDLAVKEELIRLRAEGLSFSKIADQLGVSRPTLIKWSGELQSQISAAWYAQLEALAEEYGLLKEARVKAFGQLLEKLTTELSKRELAEVPTIQLLKMVLDVSSRVRGEFSLISDNYFFGACCLIKGCYRRVIVFTSLMFFQH